MCSAYMCAIAKTRERCLIEIYTDALAYNLLKLKMSEYFQRERERGFIPLEFKRIQYAC